jgi:hypothetical protein
MYWAGSLKMRKVSKMENHGKANMSAADKQLLEMKMKRR